MVDGVSRRQLAAVTSGAKYESAPVRLEGFILFYFRKSSYKSCKRRWGKISRSCRAVSYRRVDQRSDVKHIASYAGKERIYGRGREKRYTRQSRLISKTVLSSSAPLLSVLLLILTEIPTEPACGLPRTTLSLLTQCTGGVKRHSARSLRLVSWVPLAFSAHHQVCFMVIFASLCVIGLWERRVGDFVLVFYQLTEDFRD